jgi:hypothetical protein
MLYYIYHIKSYQVKMKYKVIYIVFYSIIAHYIVLQCIDLTTWY